MQVKTHFEYYNFNILNFLLHGVGFIIVLHIIDPISKLILHKSYFALH